jgi:phage repressor protein C with HTH and peptisase S24 domain
MESLISYFGAEEIEKYSIPDEEYFAQRQNAVATIVPAEVVEEIKEEVAQAESVPILSEDLSTATDIDIRSYIDENGDELERINPSQLLQQADLAERVMRTSMLPTFAPGDIIFIRFMKDKTKLIDGETYYFDLKSLPTIIRKVKIEGDKLRLIAQNPNFGDIITTRADIVSVAKIVGLLRMTFTDFYSDIDEARKQKEAQISNMIESHTTQVDCLIKEISKFGERENRLIDILEKKL